MKHRGQAILQGKMAEKAKAAKINEPSEPVGRVPNDSERPVEGAPKNTKLIKELELQVRDLEITNRVKDQVIGMKDQFIERLQQEQRVYIERLINSSHRIGELETKLLQIEASPRSQIEGAQQNISSLVWHNHMLPVGRAGLNIRASIMNAAELLERLRKVTVWKRGGIAATKSDEPRARISEVKFPQ